MTLLVMKSSSLLTSPSSIAFSIASPTYVLHFKLHFKLHLKLHLNFYLLVRMQLDSLVWSIAYAGGLGVFNPQNRKKIVREK